MQKTDRAQFAEILSVVYETHGKTASEAVIRLWFGALEEYDIEDVSRALSQLMRSNKFLPKPADVVDILEPSGWPTAAEAWALVPKDERETGAVCDEMQAAWAACADLAEAGDMIGARRAFEGAWERVTGEVLARGKRRPLWHLSLGWDERGRSYGAKRAVDKGLLKPEDVAGYLEYEQEHSKHKGLRDMRESGRAGHVRPIGRLLGGALGGGTASEVQGGAKEVGERAKAGELDA